MIQNNRPVNPILNSGEDPWVTKYKGVYYYLYSSTENNYLAIKKAFCLNALKEAEEVIVWEPHNSDHGEGMWAPELHQIGGKWYIYFAGCDGDNKNHRMYVLEADEIMGPYREKGKIADLSDDCWAIDLTVFEHRDKWYAVWSGWKGEYCNTDFPQCLYISPLLNPWTIGSGRVMIAEPTFEWEKSVQAINEGPEVIKKNGKVFIVYSANASWTCKYCLGMLELTGEDPMDPNNWRKNPKAVFEQGESQILGPGHACFIEDETGATVMVYHAKKEAGEGWRREVRAKQVEWVKDVLNLGVPV